MLPGNEDMTAYLKKRAEYLYELENINNPKETMKYLIPFTNMVKNIITYIFILNLVQIFVLH